MTDALLHVYEVLSCYRALGRDPALGELARACGSKQWQCYCMLVGLRRRGIYVPELRSTTCYHYRGAVLSLEAWP